MNPGTPVVVVSYLLPLVLILFQGLFPGFTVWPAWIQRTVATIITVVSYTCTFRHIALYPAWLAAVPLAATAGLVGLSLVPPLAGLAEWKLRKDGAKVFAPKRFPMHLVSNVVGASATAGLVWVAHSTGGFDQFVAGYDNDVVFNVMLPVAGLVVFSFVRWQQLTACPEIEERARLREPGWQDGLTGASLRHVHQLTNTLYLIVSTFIATTTVLYLFAYTMNQAKAGHPLPLTWQFLVMIGLALGFLYVCGLPWAKEHRAVYLTFLTGTPVALGAVLVWLSWFRADAFRDSWAVAVAGVGYLLYCVIVVFGGRERGEKIQLHYFSAALIATVLVVLLGALYVS